MSASEAAATAVPTSDELPASELLTRIRELQPLIERNAAQGEQDRRVVEESIKALTDAGAFRVAQPRRHGGYQASVRTMLDVSAAVAEADGGTGWVVALSNVCAWLTGLFSERAQQEVWGADPDAKISGVLTPECQTVKVDGGFRLTGRWFYNSGSWHSSWAILGFPAVNDEGEMIDQGLALIPFTDLEIEETWFVAGMSSTGSNCLIATDVFVPDHRIMSGLTALEGQYPTEHTDETLYRSAFIPVIALVLAGPQLGMGRKALELVTSKAGSKPISYTFYATQAESTAFQLQLAQAALMIDTAHLHAYRAADDIDRGAEAGAYPDLRHRARVRADAAWATEHITKAIDTLLFAHGAGSFAQVNTLQRIWRDSAVAARHAVTLPMVNYEIYGKALLGRQDQPTFMI
jgi:alkylation response protein AidB-like acyl-CoA dehydrogenase